MPKQDRLPALAAELAELKVDVIVTAGGPAHQRRPGRRALTIPIVMATVGDADGLGLINSLRTRRQRDRRHGPVRRAQRQAPEILKEAVPKAERIAVL